MEDNLHTSYKLFLDDYRIPLDCIPYMHTRIGKKNPVYLEKDWVIAKSYAQFVGIINKKGLPTIVSFDHDLSDAHYSGELSSKMDWEEYYAYCDREMTGYDCAKWLSDYCIQHNKPLPEFYVHSMNLVGAENILSFLNNHLIHNP